MSEPRTLCDVFVAAAACGKPDLLISKVAGVWKPISAADFGFTVRALSLGLNGLGVQPGDRVAILSENRPEWAMADYAILCAGAWSVPIYPTLPAGQVAPLLGDCGARAIFVSSLEQLGKILTIKSQCPSLDHVILIDGHPPREPGYTTFHEVVDRGRPTLEMSPGVFDQRAARVKPDDVATIIYTSGTTGEPKGAMLTHGNFVSNVVTGCEVIPFTADAVALSFLPLSHVFERMLDYAYLHKTASIAYAESIEKLAANFLEVNPHCFGAVPRVYEKVYDKITAKAAAGGALKKRLFDWAVGVGRRRVAYAERGEALPGGLARKAKIADALVLKKIRAALGTRFRFAVSGGAPLSRDLAEFFIGAGVQIYEGYGLTETSPVICVNGPGRWRLGTVGRALRGIEVEIADDGEILTRGPHIMKGYFNKPEATAEAIDREGWFHTGDIGELKRRLPGDHGPQEGPDRSRRWQEGRAAADRERTEEVAVHHAPDRDRRPPEVPRGAHRPELRAPETVGRGRPARRRLGRARRASGRPEALPDRDRRLQRRPAPPRADPGLRAASRRPDDRGRLDHADPQGEAADPREPVRLPHRGHVRRGRQAQCRVTSSSSTESARPTRGQAPSSRTCPPRTSGGSS